MAGERRPIRNRGRVLLWLCLPLLLTAAVRAAWLAALPVDPIGPVDAEGFHLLAVNLLERNGFAIGWAPPFCPTAVRTPIYPLFLTGVYTLIGRAPERAVLAHILLEVVTAALVMAWARELTWAGPSSRRSMRGRREASQTAATMALAGALYAVNGLTQRFTGYLFAETLLLPALSGAVLLTLRLLRRPTGARAAVTGLAWGAALLVKPNVQYLVAAVGALVTVRLLSGACRSVAPHPAGPGDGGNATTPSDHRAPLKRVALYWGGLVLILAPWLVRNQAVLDRWVISTAFEVNTARVSAVATEAALRGVTAAPWTETWEAIYDALEARAAPPAARGYADPEAAPCDVRRAWERRIAAEARQIVVAHPGTYLGAHIRGALRGLRDPGHQWVYRLLTGEEWEATGVVADIGERMVWSLVRGAVGDALAAFWSQRVTRIPPAAGAIWWGLILIRALTTVLMLRGLWAWRDRPAALLLLSIVLVYHILLPGPIAHDRFYLPIVPVVVVAAAQGIAARRGVDFAMAQV
jgi:hypothetical protein